MRRSRTLAPLAGAAVRCQPDSRLVSLTREGRDRAFDEIVRRYRGPLVGYAGMFVSRDRAEDVVQTALSKALASLSANDAEIQLRPWLYTIVRNTALNDLRDEPRHEQIDDDFDGVAQPPQVAEQREEIQRVIRSLHALPAAQREALVQRELEGRSHEEIAAALGSSPGAVRGLIYRARGAVRDAAGFLIPMPMLRFLLAGDGLGGNAAGAGAGAGGATIAAIGGTAGGGGAKVGAALVVAAIAAVGSGVALHDHDKSSSGDPAAGHGSGMAHAASATTPGSGDHRGVGSGSGSSRGPGGGGGSNGRGDDSGPGGGSGHGDSGSSGGSGSSGSGSGSSGSSGHGGGSSGSDDSGSGGSGGSESGPGGGGGGDGVSGGGGEVETGDDGGGGGGTSGSDDALETTTGGSGSSGSGSDDSGGGGHGPH